MQKIVLTIDVTGQNLAMLHLTGMIPLATLVKNNTFPVELVGEAIGIAHELRFESVAALLKPLSDVFTGAQLEVVGGLGNAAHTTAAGAPSPAGLPAAPAPPPAPLETTEATAETKPAVPGRVSPDEAKLQAFIGTLATPYQLLLWVLRAQSRLGPGEAADLKAQARLDETCLLNENSPDAIEAYAILVAKTLLAKGIDLALLPNAIPNPKPAKAAAAKVKKYVAAPEKRQIGVA